MKIALVHNAKFPVVGYGGTERVIWWLAKALAAQGHQVILACRPESQSDFATILPIDFSKPLPAQLPGCDLLHFFFTPDFVPDSPYLVTIEGNGKAGERFHCNTNFVSRNHAERHGSTCFVYNGVDPTEYQYSASKQNYLIFLAKAAWKVKNVGGAIRIAKRQHRRLHIMGGKSLWPSLSRLIKWEGMISGPRKRDLLAKASALLFPVIWHEPFGIAIIEALISGTPVIGSQFGSLPELIPAQCGFLGESEFEMASAVENLWQWKANDCRDWAMAHFTYVTMADNYLKLYGRVLNGETLNAVEPMAKIAGGELLSLARL